MSSTLRPMTAGELLDRTFNLYRRNFFLFFGIGLLPAVFQLLMDVADVVVARFADTTGLVMNVLSTALLIAAGVIAFALSEGATVFAVSAVHLGRNISIKDCYARLRGRYLRVSGLALVQTAILVGLLGLIGAVVLFLSVFINLFLRSLLTQGMLSGAVLVVTVVLALYVFARYAVATPACVLEDLDIGDSLRRSADLTDYDRRRVFVISVLYVVLFYGTMWAMLGPLTLLAGEKFGEASLLTQGLSALATFTANALVGPVGTISLALVYYDERVRKEAFDLEHMMAVLDNTATPAVSGATAT